MINKNKPIPYATYEERIYYNEIINKFLKELGIELAGLEE